MARGKRYTDEGLDFGDLPWKKIGIVVLIVALIVGIGFGIYFGVNTYKNNQKEEEKEQIQEEEKSNMPEQIAGYNVIGRIVIEDINLDKYVLDSYEEKALQNGICKLYGNNLNERGNLVIVGHNYDDLFKKLEELEVGDEFFAENRNSDKTHYKISEIVTIEPTDLSMLLPKEDKTEITLITCQTGATTRLVVKAEKIDTFTEVQNNETDVENTVENTVSE